VKLTVEKAEEFEKPIVPDNVYDAVVAGVEEADLVYGRTVIVKFELAEGDHKSTVISGLASAKLKTNTKLGQWLQSLGYSLFEGDTFDLGDIVGKKCRIVTEKKKLSRDDGTSYEISGVVKVLPTTGPP